MSNAKIQLRLPEDLKDAAMRQAPGGGVGDQHEPLRGHRRRAARVGARAEAARYFNARGSRTTPARAKALLMRLGTPGERRDDDAMDGADDLAEG